jgi:hypothetical protein
MLRWRAISGSTSTRWSRVCREYAKFRDVTRRFSKLQRMDGVEGGKTLGSFGDDDDDDDCQALEREDTTGTDRRNIGNIAEYGSFIMSRSKPQRAPFIVFFFSRVLSAWS